MDELERARVGRARLVEAAQASQELRPRRVEVVVAVEVEIVRQREPGFGVSRFRDGDRVVELDDVRLRETSELLVERREPAPVLGVVEV